MSFLEKLQGQEIVKRIVKESSSSIPFSASKLAQRNGSELFFGHQSTVRCARIPDSTSYKVLDIPEIQFQIDGLKLNSSGTLLAVYNRNNLVITTLPSSQFMTTQESLIKVKSFVIARDLICSLKIVDLQWNKVSRFDSTVVVLFEDGALRCFDLSYSLDEPNFVYNLTVSSRNQVGYATDVVDDPVAITFGSEDSLNGQLILYILNSEGDVFSIYPFYPREIAVSKDQIEELLNETILLTNRIVDSDSNVLEKKSAINQLKFVKHLWAQVPTAQTETRGTQRLLVLKPDSSQSMVTQGPYSIEPFPDTLYTDNATGISFVNCGSVDILIIACEKSGLLFLLPDWNITMKFRNQDFEEFVILNESGEFAPSLTLLEFKKSQHPAQISLSPFTCKNKVFLKRENCIYKVDLELWANELESYLQKGDSESLAKVLESDFNSDLELLTTLSPNEQYEGLVILEDEYSSKYVAVLTSSNFNVFLLSPETQTESPKDNVDIAPIYYKTNLDSTPFFMIDKLVQDIRKFKISAPSGSNNVIQLDETGLRDVKDISTQVLETLVNYHKFVMSLNYRVDAQKKEFVRQIDTTNDLLQKLDKVEEKQVDNSESILRITQRHEALQKRLATLAEKFDKSTDLPLSNSEKGWFKEIQKTTLSFNKSVKQRNLFAQQLSFIKKEIDSKKFRKEEDQEFGEHNWDSINDILKESKKLLTETSGRLKQNFLQLEAGNKQTFV